MNRRAYLIGVGGAVALSGCSAVSSVVASEEYQQGEKESLLPDEVGEDWPDQDFEANHDLNDNFERVWATPEEDIVVMMTVEILESVDEAKRSFERSQATASDPQEYPLADEALIADDGESAVCIFRHSNALGQTLAIRMPGLEMTPDRNRAAVYAENLFDHWKGSAPL